MATAFVFHDRSGTGAQEKPSSTSTSSPARPSSGSATAVEGPGRRRERQGRSAVLRRRLGRAPRYYQVNAINRTVEAVARGQNRVLLVMATGTGKTYTAFQIIWRLWKAGRKKRILFLADRNILVDQTKNNDFKPFGAAMTKIAAPDRHGYEIYLSLYQAVTGTEEEKNIYKQFSRTSSTSSSSTNATAAAPPRIQPGARSWTTSPAPPSSA
jgi:type I restriction enzyme R subunit